LEWRKTEIGDEEDKNGTSEQARGFARDLRRNTAAREFTLQNDPDIQVIDPTGNEMMLRSNEVFWS